MSWLARRLGQPRPAATEDRDVSAAVRARSLLQMSVHTLSYTDNRPFHRKGKYAWNVNNVTKRTYDVTSWSAFMAGDRCVACGNGRFKDKSVTLHRFPKNPIRQGKPGRVH